MTFSAQQDLEVLARTLADRRGALLLAQMQRIAHTTRPATADAMPPSFEAVGPYLPDPAEKGAFQRDAARHDLSLWCDAARIPAKGARKRVVLLGESAARGYFFDPEHTLADAIAAQLGNGFEVIDLARIDLGAADLIELAIQSLALTPDALIVFAGNNWQNGALSPSEAARVAAALRRGERVEAFALVRQAHLGRNATSIAATLTALRDQAGIPLAVVVPGFNSEWQNDPNAGVALLTGKALADWEDHRVRAEGALPQGMAEAALTHALEMTTLDGGTSGISAWLEGSARRALGDEAGACLAFARAREASCGSFVPLSPRPTREVREALVSLAGDARSVVIDLPHCLQRAGLPERDAFMDYCHLSWSGLRVCAEACAEAVAQLLRVPATGAPPPPPAPANLAMAHFLAALHNAHYAQPEPVVRRHCDRALSAWPDVAQLMARYASMALDPAPNWLTPAYRDLCRSRALRRYLLVTSPRFSGKLADHLLLRVLEQSCAAATRSEPLSIDARLLARWRGLTEIDLLAPELAADTFRARQGYRLEGSFLLRAQHRPQVELPIVALGGEEVELRLELRCPFAPADAFVSVRVAGCATQTVGPVGPLFSSHVLHLTVPASPRTCHRLILSFPALTGDAERLTRAAESLELGEIPDVLPVYAELSRCTLVHRARAA